MLCRDREASIEVSHSLDDLSAVSVMTALMIVHHPRLSHVGFGGAGDQQCNAESQPVQVSDLLRPPVGIARHTPARLR